MRLLIEETRQGVAATVNTAMTLLYWRVGKRINVEILKGERAEYAEQVVSTLSRQLEEEYGRGFSAKSLRHMLRFVEVFPEERIVSALMRQLSWTHVGERLSVAGAKSQANKTIPVGSICVSCIGTIGVVSITTEPFVLSSVFFLGTWHE